MEELKNMLDYFINERLDRVILSNPRVKGEVVKAVIRPVALKGNVMYQAEEFTEKQAFHRNLSAGEAKDKADRIKSSITIRAAENASLNHIFFAL